MILTSICSQLGIVIFITKFRPLHNIYNLHTNYNQNEITRLKFRPGLVLTKQQVRFSLQELFQVSLPLILLIILLYQRGPPTTKLS
jgi:hypothetical protein